MTMLFLSYVGEIIMKIYDHVAILIARLLQYNFFFIETTIKNLFYTILCPD